ncbi:MAG: DNA polymerase III subunit delta' [Syntrophobacterales bacterium]|jgi:DNA polymerase-3 subunit delta'|nr:DNA polymerase III subunit delta' [Syntrophobacterales bacterium]
MATNKKEQVTAATPPQPSGLRFFREILGQEWVVSHLKGAMRAGRLSHAYLFLGPEGVGKATTARALAAALNCAQPGGDGDACGVCPSCRRLAAGTHPDFLVISPDEKKTQISIEQIRELRRLTEYPPLGGGWRVVLIKPAEALSVMNDAAANALLKTLEEPPPQHLLVLTARGEADLLPTIVSRCHKLAFAPLPAALIIRELESRRGIPPARAALVAALSGGSLGRALTLDPEELVRQRDQVLSDLERLHRGSAAAVLDWAQRLTKNRGDLDSFLLLAQLWYRDLLLSHFQAPSSLLAHQDLLPALAQARAQGRPETWFATFTALGAAQRQLQANLNPELTLDILGLHIQPQGNPHDSR